MTIAPRTAAVPSATDLAAATLVAAAGPRSVAANRRRRTNLRELCDEVLASFRVAREREVVSDGDREAAHSVLAELTPSLRR